VADLVRVWAMMSIHLGTDSSVTHQPALIVIPFWTPQHFTANIGNHGVCVCNILSNLGNDGVRVRDGVTNVRNDHVYV